MHIYVEPTTKRRLLSQSSDDQAQEEIATYGEIQQDYHEGCPPTFAPPYI